MRTQIRLIVGYALGLAAYMAVTAWLFPKFWTPSLTRSEDFLERIFFYGAGVCSGVAAGRKERPIEDDTKGRAA